MNNNELYNELESHLEEVIFSDWYGFNRSSQIGAETCEIKHIPDNSVITSVILPSSMERYVKECIRLEDLVLLFINDTAFIPITFGKYDEIYARGVGETGGSGIGNWMYEHVMEYMKERSEMCGVKVEG